MSWQERGKMNDDEGVCTQSRVHIRAMHFRSSGVDSVIVISF